MISYKNEDYLQIPELTEASFQNRWIAGGESTAGLLRKSKSGGAKVNDETALLFAQADDRRLVNLN